MGSLRRTPHGVRLRGDHSETSLVFTHKCNPIVFTAQTSIQRQFHLRVVKVSLSGLHPAETAEPDYTPHPHPTPA